MRSTVLVVDDHPGFRACARRLLEGQGFQVVGEAEDGASALASAEELRPQIALVDVHLPDIDGFELTARLAALETAPAVVLTSSHDPEDIASLVPASGALGFVPKEKLSRGAIEELL